VGIEPLMYNAPMEITPEQIKGFIDLHKNGELEVYTEEEIREIANGVAAVYLTLFRIGRRIKPKRR